MRLHKVNSCIWREALLVLRRYTIFGVCFDADVALDLPEAPPADEPRFALREMVGPWPALGSKTIVQQEAEDWVEWRLFAGGHVEIEWKGWLRFRIDPDGKSVYYQVQEQTYPTAFEAYVANFAVSSCLLLQGEEFLHSTVVYWRGAGIGFLGDSGAGKSTLTAHLLTLGAELVTDDMLRLTEKKGKFYAEPGQPRLKLFEEAATFHLPASVNRGRWNPLSEKYLFDLGGSSEVRPHRPLEALILLAPPQDGEEEQEIRLRALAGLELFQTLTASTMNYRLQTPDRLARQFAFASRLANRLPVYALHYPRRHDVFPEVVRALEEAVLFKCETK